MGTLIFAMLTALFLAAAALVLWVERKVPHRGGLIAVLPVRGHVEDIEYKLWSLRVDADAGIFGDNPTLIVLDLGMDAETAQVCDRLRQDSAMICCCSPETLNGTIQALLSS